SATTSSERKQTEEMLKSNSPARQEDW
ncbi:transcriptional regulator, partial [Salmonella enterica subsp. enterica serovar Kentucky]|nr:transcriptional regulator [Salmonella enterica subsp. enterica serovar Kentucky]